MRLKAAEQSRSLVRPEAIAVLKEIGIDISTNHSKPVEEFAGRNLIL